VMLGEVPDPRVLVGGGVVIAGVAIVVVSPQHGRPKAKKTG